MEYPVFVLGDKLPFTYELVTSIVTYLPSATPKKNKKEDYCYKYVRLSAYSTLVEGIWPRTYTGKVICHLQSDKCVKALLQRSCE